MTEIIMARMEPSADKKNTLANANSYEKACYYNNRASFAPRRMYLYYIIKALFYYFISYITNTIPNTHNSTQAQFAPAHTKASDLQSHKKLGDSLLQALKMDPPKDAVTPSNKIKLFIHPDALSKVTSLLQYIKANQKTIALSSNSQKVINQSNAAGLCQIIYRTKKPKSFAERANFDNGIITDDEGGSWSSEVYDILESLYPIIDCESYHTGAFKKPTNGTIFTESKPIQLIFTPGVVFEGSAGKHSNAYNRIVTNNAFDIEKYILEVQERLLPVIKHIDNTQKSVLLKVPGISCGYFGGEFNNGQTQKGLRDAIKVILAENCFKNIRGVVLDVYKKDTLGLQKNANGRAEEMISDVKFIQYESQAYNENKPPENQIHINSNAAQYDPTFDGCNEVALVAADALSLPGNDIHVNQYETNEGVWGGTTNIIELLGYVQETHNHVRQHKDQSSDLEKAFKAPAIFQTPEITVSPSQHMHIL